MVRREIVARAIALAVMNYGIPWLTQLERNQISIGKGDNPVVGRGAQFRKLTLSFD